MRKARFDGRKVLTCNNVARTARRWCIKAGLETSKKLPLLIEFPAPQHGTAAQHVANRGGYALRLAAPRRLEAALKLKRETVPAPSVSEPAGHQNWFEATPSRGDSIFAAGCIERGSRGSSKTCLYQSAWAMCTCTQRRRVADHATWSISTTAAAPSSWKQQMSFAPGSVGRGSNT